MKILVLLALLFALPSAARADDLLLSSRMHHLRSTGGEREWAEFPEQAEGAELVLAFDARPNEAEHTLRLRHRDLKQLWLVHLNGQEIARLPLDEADTITYWAVPPGTLTAGRNELRIHSTGTVADDVMIGEARLIGRPAQKVLSEATLDISVRQEPGGGATPSRITVVDRHGTRVATGNASRAQHAVRPGVVYTLTGTVRLELPAGRYVVYAGRGFEYSIARTDVNLTPGSHVSRRLSIRREVDTRGWAAMDTHVHTGTFARHGDAGIDERMLTIAGEGIELPVSAEHNMLVDFEQPAAAARARQHFTPILGSEVTTASLGHFNVFRIPADRAVVDHRAQDWVRLREAMSSVAADPVIVLNHGRDIHGGFRPLGPARHIGVAGEDLAGWSLPANAMEVVNSGAVMTDALALPRDWMGFLNRGVILAPVGSSDSHDVARYIVGQARTYVRCDDADPGRIDVEQATESLRRGRAMVSYGLLTEIDVAGKGPGELVAEKDAVDVRIRVKGPGWSQVRHVALYANGTRVREADIEDGKRPGVKWEATWRLPLTSHDVHLVAIATGPGIDASFWQTAKPYQPESIHFTPYVLGISGAVFVDADGSGTFESAFEYARRALSSSNDPQTLVARLAPYDEAVAVQAASLLRLRAPGTFEEAASTIVRAAPPTVAKGFSQYLEAWKASQRPSSDP